MGRSGQVRVDVIANAQQARNELENFGGSIRDTEKEIRFLHRTLSLFGALAIGNALLDMAKQQAAWNIVLTQTTNRLGLAGGAAKDFKDQMDKLRERAEANGITQDDLAAALDKYGNAVVKLRGELSPTEAVLLLFGRAVTLTTTYGGKLDENLGAIVDTLNAFHMPATRAEEVIQALATASIEGHVNLSELSKSVSDVAASVAKAGGSYQEALALIAQFGPTAAPAIKAAADLKAAAEAGNKGALTALSSMQIGPDASVVQIFDSIATSVASSAAAAERLAKLSGGIISQSDVENAGAFARHLSEIDHLLDDISRRSAPPPSAGAPNDRSGLGPSPPGSFPGAFVGPIPVVMAPVPPDDAGVQTYADEWSKKFNDALANTSNPATNGNLVGAAIVATATTPFTHTLDAVGQELNSVGDQATHAFDGLVSSLGGADTGNSGLNAVFGIFSQNVGKAADNARSLQGVSSQGIISDKDVQNAALFGSDLESVARLLAYIRGDAGGPIDYTTVGPPAPRVPGLASGGLVTRPTLALVGEAGPEIVMPLSKVAGLFRESALPHLDAAQRAPGAGGLNVHGDVHVNLPGVKMAGQFAAQFTDEFNAQYRSLGSRKGR